MGKLTTRCGLAAALLLSAAGARADRAVVDTFFLNHPPNGSDTDHIQSASMDDNGICIVVRGNQLPEGPHEYRMTVTDGRNKDVFHYQNELKATRGYWLQVSWLNYNKSENAPGTWTFTAEVDGQQILQRDIQVDPPSRR
jgi:hypothetical protein